MKNILLKFCLVGILLSFFIVTHADVKTVVWNHPVASCNYFNNDGYFSPIISITKVEINEKETALHFGVKFRPDFDAYITNNSCIQINGKKYMVKRADGITLSSPFKVPNNSTKSFVLYFDPIPMKTSEFDFIDSNIRLEIVGVKDAKTIEQDILPSNWRNEKTGDWEIGVFDEGVVYDCKFWNYANSKPTIKQTTFDIVNGNKKITVSFGKLKEGKRIIKIGDIKKECSKIISRTLPDYPIKDTRSNFLNNNYKIGDSVTLIGWLKDIPSYFNKFGDYYKVMFNDMVSLDDVSASTHIDSLGRFTIKVPIENSKEYWFDWKRTHITTLFEPNKVYFLLYDFKTGQELFMGEDCRLQNELLSYPLNPTSIDSKIKDCIVFKNKIDTLWKQQNNDLSKFYAAHPTLSNRYYKYQKGKIASSHAYDIRDCINNDSIAKYAYDNIFTKLEKPYTLYLDNASFLGHYFDKKENEVFFELKSLNELVNKSKLSSEDKQFMYQNIKTIDEIKKSKDRESKRELIESNKNQILKYNKMIKSDEFRYAIIHHEYINNEFLDSLRFDDEMKSIYLAYCANKEIDKSSSPLSTEEMNLLKEKITTPVLFEEINKKNSKYIDLVNRSKVSSIKDDRSIVRSEVNLSGITDGKEIINKIIEPYKGKIILLDFWGTWCPGCVKALSGSQELFNRLLPYDMVYIYLADKSEQASWKYTIDKYNVKGGNCIHYNLPKNQQEAVERFLNVSFFPTYKLIDKIGEILDIKVTSLNLDALENVIKKIQ